MWTSTPARITKLKKLRFGMMRNAIIRNGIMQNRITVSCGFARYQICRQLGFTSYFCREFYMSGFSTHPSTHLSTGWPVVIFCAFPGCSPTVRFFDIDCVQCQDCSLCDCVSHPCTEECASWLLYVCAQRSFPCIPLHPIAQWYNSVSPYCCCDALITLIISYVSVG